MARTKPLVQSASRGMRRDRPRDQMTPGSAWNLVDYIPQLGAPARKRGGSVYASPDLSTIRAATSRVEAVYHAPFAAAAQRCAWDEDGEFWKIASATSATDIGANGFAPSGITFHRDLLISSIDGTAPRKYNGTAMANLGGSPPSAAYAAVYKDRTVFAKTTANPNRVWFSAAGNPESWDTTNTYLDTTFPITAIAALRGSILVFSADRVERIRGSIPPPGTDMVLEQVFDQGTVAYKSIAGYREGVIFANPSGIYYTDGSLPIDLLAQGEMSQYWHTLMEAYTSNYSLAGGVYRGHYFLAVVDYPSTFKDLLVCNVDRRVWFRISNLPALWFARAQGLAAEELFFALGDEPRVGSLSSFFIPSASVKNDADGSAVAPVYESPFTPRGPKRRLKHVYVEYDLRDPGTDNPTLTVGYITSPEATSYTNLSDTLAETTARKRQRLPVRVLAGGFGFKISQTNASSDTRLYGIETEGRDREPSQEV